MVLGHRLDKGTRTEDVKITQDITFESMLLSNATFEGLQNSGFYKPSPIQLHGIPLGKCGFDLLLEAKSGTGKTAVFTVIALEKIDLNNGLQVVILAPTREIAAQICDVIKQIGGKYSGLSIEVVMGGLPVKDDIKKLKKKVHIIVGSPGRFSHLVRDNHIDVSAVRLLVLDEADKLMESSFKKDIEYIFSALPLQKQIIFSSATFPEESKAFINDYVQVAQHVCPDSTSVLLGISQKITTIKHHANVVRQTQHRFEELLKILSEKEFKQCLIFCNYQARVTDVYKMLKKAKWPAEKLYGQQEQLDRLEALKILQEYKCRILIATDLAARGLDSSHVDLVINFEPPFEWQTYLHRIGRAGRFGSYGLAVTILSHQEETKFKKLLNDMHFKLDIRNFWNDEQFRYTEDESKSPLPLEQTMSLLNIDDDILNEDSYSEIWNTLTCETTQTDNAVDTFDSLYSSFMKTDNNLETFNDLSDSFHKHDVEDDERNKYHCFKQTISIKKYNQHTKQNNSLLDSKAKTDLKLEANSEETEDDFVPESESYIRKCQTGAIKKNNKFESFQRKTYPQKGNHTLLKEKTMKSSYRKSSQENRYVSSESDDNGYNTASYDFKKSQCNFANYETYMHNTKDNKYYTEKQKRSKEHEYTSKYFQWYNALKFRTQQIEMAVYINEMSQNVTELKIE